MTPYGQRLEEAMRAAAVDRKALAHDVGISVQALGQAINGRPDRPAQGLSFKNNLMVARRLGVDPNWLATGEGTMVRDDTIESRLVDYSAGTPAVTPLALELAALFDLIPPGDRVTRAKAYGAASEAIVRVLHDAGTTPSQDADR